MLNVSRGCHCTNLDPPVAGPVLPGHGVRYVLTSPALERLKDCASATVERGGMG